METEYGTRTRQTKRKLGTWLKILIAVLLVTAGSLCAFAACLYFEEMPEAAAKWAPLATSVPVTEKPVETPEPRREPAAAPLLAETRYYRNTLTPDEQVLYDQIAEAVGNHEYNVTALHAAYGEQVEEITDYVFHDFPEYFWMDGSYWYTELVGLEDTIVDLMLSFSTVDEAECHQTELAMQEAAAGILAELETASDYEKVKGVYDYVIEHTTYDEEYTDEQDLRSVLLEGRGVCAGYARCVQYLLQQLGVECSYVTGVAEEAHAWNIVNIEGEYYALDATWGDPVPEDGEEETRTYDYFCVTTEEIGRSHTPSGLMPVPECTATEYNFHHRVGRFFEEYSKSAVSDVMYTAASNGYTYSFKLGSKDEFEDAIYHLIEEEDHMEDICQDIMSDYGASNCTVATSYNEDMYIISVEIELFY